MQSLCTLRNHCRQRSRNTRYQAAATPYSGRTSTGWIAPACGWRTYSITSSALFVKMKNRMAYTHFSEILAVMLIRHLYRKLPFAEV
jgi:hypothetical protein